MNARFVTDAGLAVAPVTTEQMRELDRTAIDGPGPTLQQMMENAGRTMAELTRRSLQAGQVLVLAGPGGNGGGGLCAARHLANGGAKVTVVLTTDRPGPSAMQQLELFRETGGAVMEGGELDGLEPEVVIDAMIGYGLDGPPRGAANRCIRWANAQDAMVIALDLPSGLDATTGSAAGAVIRATKTLTLAMPKTGLSAAEVGDLWLADLGIPEGVYRSAGIDTAGVFETSHLVHLSTR